MSAFGDGSNDAEMLKEVGFGVAMKNAKALPKSMANKVSVWTNHEDAVGREILDLIRADKFGHKCTVSDALVSLFD